MGGGNWAEVGELGEGSGRRSGDKLYRQPKEELSESTKYSAVQLFTRPRYTHKSEYVRTHMHRR